MAPQEFCQDCNRRHNCQEAYRQLDRVKTPSIASKVVVVFLLPLLVFIATLATFEAVLVKVISIEKLRTALSFLLALLAAFILILIIKSAYRHPGKSKKSQGIQK